uniref:Uncharacterized protein n=1 Tax=Hypsizygus marmoreus TaxID=39966 RepID=A0A4P8D2T1_HYPMA|nr:hypothetical protein [Hypsizygus marmoreus]
MIEDHSDRSLKEIFAQGGNNVNNNLGDILFIHSPLEFSDLSIIHNDLITILNYNLIVNLFMVYLILMLVFIFTIKFVIDSDLFLEKVKTLPLGKYLYYILNKLISIWKNSSILWIYFILFFFYLFLVVHPLMLFMVFYFF